MTESRSWLTFGVYKERTGACGLYPKDSLRRSDWSPTQGTAGRLANVYGGEPDRTLETL